jgi:hypothetical protein
MARVSFASRQGSPPEIGELDYTGSDHAKFEQNLSNRYCMWPGREPMARIDGAPFDPGAEIVDLVRSATNAPFLEIESFGPAKRSSPRTLPSA